MADGSALVLVLPGDTVEAIADRVRQAPPGNVQLLVSEGVTVLQVASNVVRLGQAIGPRWRDLQLITSDEQTLRIARALKIETVGVSGARVGPAAAPSPVPAAVATPASPAPSTEPSPAPTIADNTQPATPATASAAPAANGASPVPVQDAPAVPSTAPAVQPADNPTPVPPEQAAPPSDNASRVLPPEPVAPEAESAKTIVLPPVAGTPPQLSPDDAAFIDALERMPAQEVYSDARPDADLYDDLDDFSDVIGTPPPQRPARSESARPTPTRRPDPPRRDESPRYIDQPRRRPARPLPEDDWDDEELDPEEELPPRRRADDYDLDDEELLRQRRVRRGDLRTGSTSSGRSGRRSGRLLALDEEEPPRRRTATGLLPLLLVVLVVALLFGLGALWYLSARTTVTVYVPPPQTRSFSGEVLPLQPNTQDNAPGAIQAIPLNVTVAFTATGTGTQEPTPAGYAQGQVLLVNRLDTALDLPAGTEFIASNPAGEEVRFWNPDPASVPPATSTPTDGGVTIRFGQATVAIRARSPGSQANTEANVISQIVINGQVISTGNGNLQISHEPLTGGTEENQFVVTQQAVDAVLGGAYPGLYDAMRAQLRVALDSPLFTLDEATILPRFNQETQSFDNLTLLGDPIVSPPVGTPLDPNNPTFSVLLQVNAVGLGTPPSRSIQQQFATVLPAYLQNRQPPPCRVEEMLDNVQFSSWQWDGTRLIVDGSADCKPNEAEVDRRVREAVLGKTTDAADLGLQELQALGLIDRFDLPLQERLPGQGWLLDVVLVPSASPNGQTALPEAPTPEGAQP
ncbi:MAG: hypothetical protein OHK0022_54280 [Roseiflexaceae bacterium]